VAHIILIEDNPADVLLVKLALEESQIAHQLTSFESGAEAVERLCGPSATDFVPDAILLDINTPRCDGFVVLAALRQRFAYVPITIVTSSRARADKKRASTYGADYIEKPSDLQSFIEAIGSAVRRMLAEGQTQSDLAPHRNETHF
jgi:CheY-like chemotaxis protein